MKPIERAIMACHAWPERTRTDMEDRVAKAITEAVAEERAACLRACEETAANLERCFRANPDHNDDVAAGALACVEAIKARGGA